MGERILRPDISNHADLPTNERGTAMRPDQIQSLNALIAATRQAYDALAGGADVTATYAKLTATFDAYGLNADTAESAVDWYEGGLNWLTESLTEAIATAEHECLICDGQRYLLHQTYECAAIPDGWTPVQRCDSCSADLGDDEAAALAAAGTEQAVAFFFAEDKDEPGDYAIESTYEVESWTGRTLFDGKRFGSYDEAWAHIYETDPIPDDADDDGRYDDYYVVTVGLKGARA